MRGVSFQCTCSGDWRCASINIITAFHHPHCHILIMLRCLRPFVHKMLLLAFRHPPAGLTSSIDDISSIHVLHGFQDSTTLNLILWIRHGPFFSFPYSRCCRAQRHSFRRCSYPRWRTSRVRQVLTLKVQHITGLADGPWSSLSHVAEDLARQLPAFCVQPKTSDLIFALARVALTSSL